MPRLFEPGYFGWGWGDGHNFGIFARADDLKAGRFDRIRSYDG